MYLHANPAGLQQSGFSPEAGPQIRGCERQQSDIPRPHRIQSLASEVLEDQPCTVVESTVYIGEHDGQSTCVADIPLYRSP